MKFNSAFTYIALLGTAVGTFIGTQQVNLSMAAVLALLLIMIFTAKLPRLKIQSVLPIAGLWLAAAPGTSQLILVDGTLFIVIMQYFGVLFVWIAVWSVFSLSDYQPVQIFKVYLNCARICSVVAILQQIGYLIGIEQLYDLRWLLIGAAELDFAGQFLRVNSLFTEPSYFAAFIMPAVYCSILCITGYSKIINIRDSMLFILALICTFSTIGYIGAVVCLFASLRLNLRAIIVISTLSVLLWISALSIEAISDRLYALPIVMDGNLDGHENFTALNYGLNFEITKNILRDTPIWGIGMGGYRVVSIDYLNDFLSGNSDLRKIITPSIDVLTLADGSSMYLRLPAEIGFGGILLLMLIYFRRNHYATKYTVDYYIKRAALIFMVVFSMRSGQIVRFDVIFFWALFCLIHFPLIRASSHRVQ